MDYIKFQMTPKEYIMGVKFRDKNSKNRFEFKQILSIICVLILVIIMIFQFTNQFYFYYALVTLLLVGLASLFINNKTKQVQYQKSPILNTVHTLKTYNEGIEIISSLEKIYVPFDSIFAWENQGNYLTIIPIYEKGIFVIDKTKQDPKFINNLLNQMNEKASNSLKGGKN